MSEVNAVVMRHRHVTIQEIAEEVGVSTFSANFIMTEDLAMKKVAVKFVSKLLTVEQEQLRAEISQDKLGKQWAVYNALEKDKHGRDAAFLDQYAAERWECVLHFMVGCHTTEGISVDAVRTLLHAGLMKSEEGESSSPLITMDGFQFLLMDTASQVWHFVLQYLDTLESRGLNLVECLTFLFQCSFLTLGKEKEPFFHFKFPSSLQYASTYTI
nr:general transcription factor IIH subunit 4-like [Rhipicephalus microplus]